MKVRRAHYGSQRDQQGPKAAQVRKSQEVDKVTLVQTGLKGQQVIKVLKVNQAQYLGQLVHKVVQVVMDQQVIKDRKVSQVVAVVLLLYKTKDHHYQPRLHLLTL